MNCSKMTTVGDFIKALVNHWGLDAKEAKRARLWDYFNKSRYALLSDTSMLMNEANINENQDMMIEFQQVGLINPL